MSTMKGHKRRHVIGRRFGWFCAYCGRPLACPTCEPDAPAAHGTLDHKVPRARGGTDALANLVLACVPCNQAKADQSCVDVDDRDRFGLRLDDKAIPKEREPCPRVAFDCREDAVGALAPGMVALICGRCGAWHVVERQPRLVAKIGA